MTFWFSADSHYHHANIIKYCNRPFKDVAEMNETMISNWNKVVENSDIVYHLGDFSFSKHVEELSKRLNGQIILIKGNHDKLKKWPSKFVWVGDIKFIKIDNIDITLCHYSMRVWKASHFGAYMLFGHSHGTLKNITGRTMDVGVDCHNFTPISFEKVREILETENAKTGKNMSKLR